LHPNFTSDFQLPVRPCIILIPITSSTAQPSHQYLKHAVLETGRPLGRVSLGKKIAVPNSFFGPSSLLENLFCTALLEPVISSFDFGHLLDAHYFHRGDPFSHPSGSSARTEKSSSASFFSSLYIKNFFVFVVLAFDCAHPATAGPESVQCRLAFIQLVRALVSP